MSCSTIVAGATPYDESHAIPSRTRPIFTVYGPAFAGALTMTVVTAFWPGATSAGSDARAPSHTATEPSEAIQWYETWTGFGPPAGQVTAPVFATVSWNAFAPRMNVDCVLAVGA